MDSGLWESGLNMFSLNTIRKKLNSIALDIKFHKFEITIDLEKQENPIRTYTIDTKDGKRLIVNGANIVRDFYLVEFIS